MPALPQAIAAGALVLAAGYFGYKAYSSWMGTTAPVKTDPKPKGATIDLSTVAGVQQGAIALDGSGAVGPDGADGKNGKNTGAWITKFRAANGLPASTTIDNALRAAMAVKLRAAGYTVIGETGPVAPPVSTSKTSADDAKGAKTSTAKELYAKADALEAQADALNDQADEWEAEADDPDTSFVTATALRVKIKANRDKADKLMGEADGYRGAAKLAEATPGTKGYGANVGAIKMPPWMRARTRSVPAPATSEAARVRKCFAEGQSDGYRDRQSGREYNANPATRPDGKPFDFGTPELIAACLEAYGLGYADGWHKYVMPHAPIAARSTLPPYLRGRLVA